MSALDPRLHAFRPDLADIRLRGRVEAARFAPGEVREIATPLAPVRRAPSPEAELLTEAFLGERVTVFEARDVWAWGQLEADSYVGWLPAEALREPGEAPTHRVAAPATLLFPAPDMKRPPIATLPMGARLRIVEEAEDRNARYGNIAWPSVSESGWVVLQHIAELAQPAPLPLVGKGECSLDDRSGETARLVASQATDFVAVAERFLDSPYLWGGRTRAGIDCSGLVQIALGACGMPAPRDSDMQERALGRALPLGGGLPALARGDLLFWKGHVGMMRDTATLLHANAHHMAVASEPVADAIARFAAKGLPVTAIRRIAFRPAQ